MLYYNLLLIRFLELRFGAFPVNDFLLLFFSFFRFPNGDVIFGKDGALAGIHLEIRFHTQSSDTNPKSVLLDQAKKYKYKYQTIRMTIKEPFKFLSLSSSVLIKRPQKEEEKEEATSLRVGRKLTPN